SIEPYRWVAAVLRSRSWQADSRAPVSSLDLRAMLMNFARKGLDIADSVCALVSPRSHAGSGALITLLFHSLYRNRAEVGDPQLAPNQNITKEEFKRLVGHVLDLGYTPVSP